jgi:molybdenum cofactor biosynthesis protein B
MSHIDHRNHAERQVEAIRCAVLTISDTRTYADDRGGQYARDALVEAGHVVEHYTIVKDEPADVVATIDGWILGGTRVIVTTGGTGISRRDTTVDAIEPQLTRVLPGFGEIFRMLSYEQVGAAAMLSRAIAGTWGTSLVFCLPGSPNAVELAMTRLIVPELRHLVWETLRHGMPQQKG